MRIRSLSMFALVVLLSGCQLGVMVRSDGAEARRVTEVRLLKPLTVAADATRVFVQDGKAIAQVSDADEYRTLCAFELLKRMETEQTIQTGVFQVTRVQALMEQVVQWKPLKLAGLFRAGMDDGGSSQVHLGYHFWLKADQPELMRMSCYGVFEQLELAEPPTLEEIRHTLAGVAEVGVAE